MSNVIYSTIQVIHIIKPSANMCLRKLHKKKINTKSSQAVSKQQNTTPIKKKALPIVRRTSCFIESNFMLLFILKPAELLGFIW